ncbi:hypothetical protein HW555_000239 [Spodoptera exigua]|uniref:Uncharacterized protein n=1 Tax=Spodoptera exigua TaxID=7107 RepID=A0A835GVH2_SPOEX|nr:hypothetical protein HW555_000239 [Spodoptera exigua]
MKVLLLLSLLAVASSYPIVNTWTFSELIAATENKKAGHDIWPYVALAFNEIMVGLFSGNTDLIDAAIPSPSGADTWTVEEVKEALKDPTIKPDYLTGLRSAEAFMKHKNETGELEDRVEVLIPALDISTWTESDLTQALNSPSTKKGLLPFLEKAFNDLKVAQENCKTRNIIYMMTPVGLIPPKDSYHYVLKPSKNRIKKGL